MASLSLPRVLQLKKNSLDAEREQFEKFQTLAIQKAINAIETPVKEKHVRSTIIGTYQEQSAITYWMVAIRLPLQDNRIVSWKFCHVTHKLLREGHPACLDDSQRHISMIENLGRLWVHLREGYGKLVHLYCNLLVCKLKFHARNPRFPGNMQLTADELDAIAENDVNNYFQLCVELFDYMDDILTLQAAVFDSLGNARANSMTASGQCRLAALIPCAQDSSQIYDCNVRLLFRLHASLPSDTLQGHRERFRQQFKKLSSFYKHASSLQYYRNLLSLPVLPSNPPNFLQQSDFGTYVTPVVSIPEPAPDEVDAVASLIDTSDTISQMSSEQIEESFERAAPSPQPDPVVERDRLIEHLQNELKRMRGEVSGLVQERNTMLGSMRDHCTRLESQLHSAQSELEQEKHKAELFAVQTPEIQQKLSDTEEKAKVQDEKFQKLKGAYTQLREEHITLIRQKAEVDKLSAGLRAAAAQHESAKVQLQQQLDDRMKDVELLQQSASSSEEIEGYQNQIADLRNDLEKSRLKELELESVKASLVSLEIEHKTATTEQEDKINTISVELKEATESLELIKKEKEERETELSKVKVELVGLREKSGDDYKRVVEEKEAALAQVAELTESHRLEKEELTQHMRGSIDNLQAEIETLQQHLADTESNYAMECERLNEELTEKHKELDNNLIDKDHEIKEALDKITALEIELENSKASYENKIEELSSLKDYEINNLKQEIQTMLDKNKTEIHNLQMMLEETSQSGESQKSESKEQAKKLTELEIEIDKKNNEIEVAKHTIEELNSNLNKTKIDHDNDNKDSKYQLEILETKMRSMLDSKDEIINNFKSMISDKDSQVITLNVEVTKLTDDVFRLTDQLNETQAELEICNNELLALKEEHEQIVYRNDDNVTMKNKELRELHCEIKTLKDSQTVLETEKQEIVNETAQERQVLENKISELNDENTKLLAELDTIKSDKIHLETKLNEEINLARADYDQVKNEKENDEKVLNERIQIQEDDFKQQLTTKDGIISQVEEACKRLETEIDELKQLKAKEKEDIDVILSKRDNEKQKLESRMGQIESKRLTAECDLQDLLQHNTVLEEDVADLRKQLEDAQRKIEEQISRLLSCTAVAADDVLTYALASMEVANAQESNKMAAEQAARALGNLSKHTQIKGNEDNIAMDVVTAAHNAAQLSAYVTEVTHVSTNVELTDKLTNDCRSMLIMTKQCVTALSRSEIPEMCASAAGLVTTVAQAAAAADVALAGARSVDDELADMDLAIEQAANKIEELLAASRAGDSGVKLEVNEKILDACTTLMGAVKILVQDARRLQRELGDPTTRLHMYRKNPQWSEGLISAAKAVVFAAKLLVSSADEVVGSSGSRVEGVSAAAHEVASSTAQLVAASRARAPPAAPSLARLTHASRDVATAVGALVAAVRAAAAMHRDAEALDTSALTLTATRRLEMESKVRSLELETELDAERIRLAALRKRHYQLAQAEENGNVTNGKK